MICSVIMFVTRALRSDFPVHGRPHTFGLPTIYRCLEKKILRVFTAILSANLLVFSQMGSCRVWKTWWVEASGWLSAKYWKHGIFQYLVLVFCHVSAEYFKLCNIEYFHEIAKDLKYVGYFYCCGYSAMWKLQVKFPMVNLGPRDKWDIKGKVKKEKKNQLNSYIWMSGCTEVQVKLRIFSCFFFSFYRPSPKTAIVFFRCNSIISRQLSKNKETYFNEMIWIW